jgi:uncharacterized membrane protein YeaQ/YmgE (transglycosylase-associated protein family)
MEILILVAAMILVGLLVGALSPKIFKGEAPYGVRADYIGAVIAAILTGLLDWYLIPMIIDSEVIKYIGVATEPALVALLVLWLMRKAKS